MEVGKTLVREGLVSADALAHAEGVQRRGFGTCSVTDLLVDLEYVEEDAMAQALGDLAGAALWTGQRETPSILTGGVLSVRSERGRLYYATADPFDEDVRQRIKGELGVRELVPLVTTRTRIAEAQIEPANRLYPDSVAAPAGATSEAELRRAWANEDESSDDDDFIRDVNWWLLMTSRAPGRVLRAQAFDTPMASVGTMRRATPIRGANNRSFVEAAIFRIAYMARAEPGPGLRNGRLLLYAPRLEVFAVEVASTPRGEALWCQRMTPWAGVEGIAGSKVAELRRAFGATDDLAQQERIARAALERAHADEELLLDRLWALAVLAGLLDADSRESESRVFAEEGLALVQEHGLRGRAGAEFRLVLACNEIADPAHRATLLGEARRAACAAGAARRHGLYERVAEITSRLRAGEWEACVRLAEAALKVEYVAFGASTCFGTSALALGVEALTLLGRVEEARAMVARIDTTRCPQDAWRGEYARGVVAAGEGRHRQAVDHFARAFDLPGAALLMVATAWARALVAAGRTNEAIAVARRVEDAPVDVFSQREAAELERIRRMAPYR